MTTERRLAKVEAVLTPTQRVLAWLDEAHAFGSLSAYVDSLLDQPPDAFPINRLAREAATATRAALRGKRPEIVDAAVRKSLRATVFRFELVMRINVVTHEMIDREVLIYAVFAGQLALLASEDRAERLTDEGFLRRLGQCRDITMSRVDEMMAAQEARSNRRGALPRRAWRPIPRRRRRYRRTTPVGSGAGGHGGDPGRTRRPGSGHADGPRCDIGESRRIGHGPC